MKHNEEILLSGTTHDHWIIGRYNIEVVEAITLHKVLNVEEAVLKHFIKGTKEKGEHEDMPLEPGIYIFGDLMELDITKNEYVRQSD